MLAIYCGDVAPRHIDALQLALLVADGVDGRFVVHLARQSYFFRTVALFRQLVEVDDAACVRILYLVEL